MYREHTLEKRTLKIVRPLLFPLLCGFGLSLSILLILFTTIQECHQFLRLCLDLGLRLLAYQWSCKAAGEVVAALV